jgi:hypothetical protein
MVELISYGESQTLEFKKTTGELKDLHILVSQKIDINKRSFKAELQNLKNLKLISTEGQGAAARWGLKKEL